MNKLKDFTDSKISKKRIYAVAKRLNDYMDKILRPPKSYKDFKKLKRFEDIESEVLKTACEKLEEEGFFIDVSGKYMVNSLYIHKSYSQKGEKRRQEV